MIVEIFVTGTDRQHPSWIPDPISSVRLKQYASRKILFRSSYVISKRLACLHRNLVIR